jgi:hypothetical protein
MGVGRCEFGVCRVISLESPLTDDRGEQRTYGERKIDRQYTTTSKRHNHGCSTSNAFAGRCRVPLGAALGTGQGVVADPIPLPWTEWALFGPKIRFGS